jgi:hypothetical protein
MSERVRDVLRDVAMIVAGLVPFAYFVFWQVTR